MVLDDARRLLRLRIDGLFGSVSRTIDLSGDASVVILAGPNGSGKTHVLKLAHAVLAMDISALLDLPYEELSAEYDDESVLTCRRTESDALVELRFTRDFATRRESLAVNSEEFVADETDALPAWIRRVGDNRWFDERLGRSFGRADLQRRYGITVGSDSARTKLLDLNPWLADLVASASPTFIDTKRLDTPVGPRGSRDEWIHGISQPRGAAGRISDYTEQVRTQIAEARRESLARSQDADESFASNLLKRARRTVRQENLVRSFERLSRLSDELSENGLAGKAMSVTIPSDTNPTERRVLDLFLQDWERKLQPLLPVHRKVTALRRIVNGKFVGKTLALDSRGVLRFKSDDGKEVPVNVLSSGEQHLLALFTMLLFAANEGSLVFIDEPEISLHAAWKHAFVDDLEVVAELSSLRIVFATHSTAVINGRWELVQELGVK